MYGELIPIGGGDPIPLLKDQLLVGRRESCDIVLRFANVSAHHCQLSIDNGYLYVRDMQSRNGIKVNDVRVQERRLDPGDILAVAKHRYRVEYDPADLGAVGPPPPDNMSQEIMRESLLSRAGLEHAPRERDAGNARRYDPSDMKAGQIKLPDQPV
jgi:predicted component of type VI protein secretion system